MSSSGPSRAEPPAPLVGPEPSGEARNTAVVARRLLPHPPPGVLVSWCARGHVWPIFCRPFGIRGCEKVCKKYPIWQRRHGFSPALMVPTEKNGLKAPRGRGSDTRLEDRIWAP